MSSASMSRKRCWRARADTQDDSISYTLGDLEHIELPPQSFGLVYSSLALHYVEKLERLMAAIHRALIAGGRFVFSVEHPIYTAPSNPGWAGEASGRKSWPVDSYLDEGPRSTDWLTKGVIKQHRTLATYMNMLIGLGFTLRRIEEWAPSEKQIAAHPEWENERQRPPFLLMSAQR
jgi:ubiquinone/menaquinone biosynthesis C-methylase UbiE